jgi:hypothetical protein
MLRFRYSIAAWFFRRRFHGEGGFTSCSFLEHFGGYVHNVWLPIDPEQTADETLDMATIRFKELCLWLRSVRRCFRGEDRCQIVVGFPLELKPRGHQVLKGWLPARELYKITPDTDPSALESLGGGCSELSNWRWGLFDDGGLPADGRGPT